MKKNVLQTASKAAKLVVYSIKKTQFPVWLCILLNTVGYGQSTGNYGLNTLTNGSLAQDLNSNTIDMSTGTTTLLAANVDDSPVSSLTNMNLGTGSTFDFYLMGTRYTSFGVSANGILTLGATPGTTVYALPNSTVPTISAFANDMKTGTDGNVIAKVVGTAPNRTLVIQWTNVMIRYLASNGPGTGTWQVRLYESSGIIEHVYGAMTTNTATPALYYVGFSVNTTANNLVTLNTNTNVANTTATATANSYTASSTITDLNSTSNGSRKIYRFTPPSVAAPTSLTFSSITATGMTLNWTASSPITGVLRYAVYSSSDGGATYSFVNTTNVGTNTLAITGLTPGTTYMYRVFAVSEGALSTALTGSQATSAAATYYWVGASGADWNTAASWNTQADNTGSQRTTPTTNDILIVDGAGTTAGTATTISISASQSVGVLRISDNTAVTLQSSTSTTRTITLTGGSGDELDIPSGCSLILNNATQAIAIAFSTGTGMTGNISGTLTFGGSTSNTLTTTGGTGTVVTVTSSGIVNLGAPGNSLIGSTATLVFANGSNCNSSGATSGAPPVPLATWGATSNLTITGITTSTTAPTNNVQSFGNIVYNCPAATSTSTMSFFTSNTVNIQGNLTISSTGGGKFRCVTSGTLTVSGNLVISGSSICDLSSSSGTVNVLGNFTHSSTGTTTVGFGSGGILNVSGGFNVSAGTFDLASSGTSTTVRVGGTFNQTGGTITESSTSTASVIEFNGSASQSVTLGTISNTISYRINNNAGISLTGTMAITTGAGLIISSTAAMPISGGTLSYSGTTTLTYNGLGNQTITANEFPSSAGPSSLVINNTGTAPNNRVDMASTGSRTLSGTFTQTSGILLLGNNNLTVTGTVSGTASSTNFVATNGTGALQKIYTGTGSVTFPLGDVTGTDEASSVVLNLTAFSGTSSTIGIRVIDAQHPNDGSSDNYLSRYWSFTESGATSYTYSLTLNYPASDVVGTATSTKLNRYNTSAWTQTSTAVPSTTSVAVTGITSAAAPLSASDFTLRPAAIVTYTWRGGTSAAYNVSTNWSPTRSLLDATDILLFDGSNIDGAGGTGSITATAVPTETIGKLLLTNNAVVGIQAGTAANTLTIAGGTGTDLDIPSGSTLNNNGSNAMNIAFSGSGNVAAIAGTFQMTGAGHSFSATNSVTTVTGNFTISHSATNAGGTVNSTASNLIFSSGSTYTHARDGGTIPTAAFDAASNINITGITATSVAWPSGTVTAGNLTWNCASQTVNPQTFASVLTTINGTFNLISTGAGSGTFQFGTAPAVTIAGLTTISGGTYNAAGGTVSFNGGLSQSGGTITGTSASTLNAASCTQSGGTFTANASTITMNISGALNQSGGATLNGGASGTLNVNFNHASNNQSVTLNGTISNRVNFSITGAANSIALTGTMAINTSAGLTITTTNATPLSGGTLSYTGTTTLTYNGTGNQTMNSTVFPASAGPANLVINNTGTAPNNRVDMASTGSRTLLGTFTQTAGVFLLGNNDLTVTGAISGTASNTNFVATNGTGQLMKVYGTNGSTTFPLGDITGTDEASSVTLNYTALTGISTVGARVVDAQHPNDGSATDYLARYWSFTESGATAYTYTITLNYPSVDIIGTASNTRMNRYNSGSWVLVSGSLPTTTSAVASGLTFAVTPLQGSDFTLRTATISSYTWRGGATGAYNTGSNWSPTRLVTDAADILTFDGNNIDGMSGTGAITATSVPTETIGKLLLTNNANVSIQAGAANNTLTIAGGTGTDLDIPSGCTLNNNGSSALNIAFSGTGQTANIAGTFQMTGAGHSYSATNSVTTVTGSFTISHNVANAGGTVTSTATNLLFTGGTLNYARDGGTIPAANYNAASTILVTGVTATLISWPSGAVAAGNLTWNCTGQTLNPHTFLSTLTTINGGFSLQSTGTGTFQFGTSPSVVISGASTISGGTYNAAGGTVSYNGGLTQSGGTITGVGSSTLNASSFIQSGGTLTAATQTITLNISGTLDQSVGAVLNGGTGTLNVNFNHASNTQTVNLNGTISNRVNFGVIGAGNSLDLSGTMAVNNTASLTVTTTAAPITGAGALVYSGATTLIYNATTGAQTAGLEFPASSGPSSLTINNTTASPNNTVTVSGNRSISTLTLTAGILQMGANTLTITGTTAGAVSGGGASAFVSGGLERTLPASLASGSTYTFPIGKGTYNLFEMVNPTTNAGGTVVVRAEVFDANAGGTAGTNLTNLSTTRYWLASFTSGSGNFTNTTVRLTESGLSASNRIGQSATQMGTYNSVGGSVSGSTIISNAVTTLNYFVIGVLSGTSFGTYTVCPTGCDYSSLTRAGGVFADLNARPFSANVTLSIQGDLTTEDGANSLNQWTETGGSNYTLTIQPSGGVTRTISGSTSSTALMNLNGADRVTINGLNTGGNALLIRNTNTSAATIRFINDATNNTIQNCTIEGNVTSTTSGVVLFSSGTATGNDNNTLTGNLIRDRSDATGVPANGIYSAGTSASIANSDNTITNNQIFNWTASGVTISATGNGNNWNISNNSLYQTATRSTALTGIALLSAANGNTVSNNSIGGADANRGGATMTGSEFYGINLSVGTTTATSVQGNLLGNITTTSTSAEQYGIGISSGNANIGTVSGNTIGEATANSINVANSFDGIFVSSSGSVDVRNNLIRNLKYDAADFERLSGIYATGGIVTIKDNTIRDLIHRGTTTSSLTTVYCPWGIRVASTTAGNLIEGNTIFNISLEFNGANSTSTYPMYGIGVTGAVTNTAVTRNRIYNLTTTRTGTTTSAPSILGIYANAGAVTYSNNQISIAQSTASTQPLIRGILLESTANNNFYYNSVYIGGSAAAANNTFGFLRNSTSGTQTLYNNLLYNERGGTGAHYAIGNNSTTGWSTNVTNDYNLLVTANSANLGLWVSTASTFSAWRTSSGSDTYSWSDLNTNLTPANLFTDHTTGNLNIQVANVESWYVAGKGVQISGLSADFGDLSANRPTTVPAGATDIGSDEIGTPGIAPHALTAVPALGVTNFTFAGRTVASVNWVSGTLPSTITTRYYSGETPPNPTCSNASAQYADAYWDITPDVTSGYVFDLSLVYTPAILGTIPAETDGRLSENELLCWQGYPASTVNTTAKTVTQTGLSTFSLWTISAANALLPIELVRFDAIENGPANRIEWATASEVDLRRFVVERSSDGIQFRDWAEAAPQGQPGVPAAYALDDKEPPVVAYYRLRSENLDGSFDYSKVVVVARKVEKLRLLALYPSPAEEQITLQLAGLENSDAQVLVLRLDGTLVQQQTIGIQAGVNTLLLDVQALPAGMYQVILLGERQSTAPMRFVKL